MFKRKVVHASPVALFIRVCPFLGAQGMDLIIMGQRSEACGVLAEGWSGGRARLNRRRFGM